MSVVVWIIPYLMVIWVNALQADDIRELRCEVYAIQHQTEWRRDEEASFWGFKPGQCSVKVNDEWLPVYKASEEAADEEGLS